MAKMIPATMTSGYRLEAEELVFDQLKTQLDDSFTVFHSFDVAAKNRENRIVDVEIDFVILSQNLGILVLEVKGGQIRYDGMSGQWTQNGKPLGRDPFQQARDNKYAIKTFLETRIKSPLSITLGHSVCFPDVYSEVENLPADAIPEIVLSGSMLPYIKEFIESVLIRFAQNGLADQRHTQFRDVRAALIPVFEYANKLADRVGQADMTVLTLTEQQCSVLEFLDDRKRVLIRGCAGSGKTVLALKKAEQLASLGNKVLLLCYNNILAAKLAEPLSKNDNQIVVCSFHEYCLSVLEAEGQQLDPTHKDHLFWQRDLPQLLLDQLEKTPRKFDAIIVDEGQDFTDEYWLCIEELLVRDGYFYIFYDPDQNVFNTNVTLPISDTPFALTQNCRNTKKIVALAKGFCSGKMIPHNRLPEGDPVQNISYSTRNECVAAIAHILHHVVYEQNIQENRIVILGAHSLEHTTLQGECKIGNFTIKSAKLGGVSGRGEVPFYTFMKYKGCEADVVLLLDVSATDARWSQSWAYYSAVTRAKYLLYVLEKK